jgi:hypothetical protein
MLGGTDTFTNIPSTWGVYGQSISVAVRGKKYTSALWGYF